VKEQTYASSTETELDCWGFRDPAVVTDAVAALLLRVQGSSVVVGGSRLSVVSGGGHCADRW
jgi:hypothetical protein